MIKPFDPAQYDRDDDAKHQIIQFLRQKGFAAMVNPDKYGIDVVARKQGVDFTFEVEVKHNWKGEVFPFDTVHFSARKLKFVSGNTYFAMLNNERTHALFVSGEVFKAAPITTKDTKYTKAEQFVTVRVADCKFRSLLDLSNPFNS